MKLPRVINLLLTATLALGITGYVLAGKPQHEAPDGLETVKSRQLDRAWVNPEFNPDDYQTIIVTWGDFEYQPGKDRFDPMWNRSRIYTVENYTMPERDKAQLEHDAVTVFAQELEKLEGFNVINKEQADDKTMTVKLQLKDIANHVPDQMQMVGRYKVYIRDLRTITLDMEFQDNNTGETLFKGYVRDHVEAHGGRLDLANTLMANHQTKWKLKRWARGMEKGLDNMK